MFALSHRLWVPLIGLTVASCRVTSGVNDIASDPPEGPVAAVQDLETEIPTVPSPEPNAGIEPSPASSQEACPKVQTKADQIAKHTFRQAHELSTFINSLGLLSVGSGDAKQAAFANDPDTAAKICELKGYKRVLSIGHNRYQDCESKTITRWDSKHSAFVTLDACRFNDYIDFLTCRGLIVKKCN